jgi:hypothetical protein
MSGSATCKLCGRPVVWGKTQRNANLCVDPDPRPKGGYILEATGVVDGRVQFAVRRARPDEPAGKRWTCHLDTCPQRRRTTTE